MLKTCSKKTFDNFCPQFKVKTVLLRSLEIAAFVKVLSCSWFCGYPIRIWITFFNWDTLISRVWITDLDARLPRGRNWLHFHRKLINCLLKHCEIWKKGQFNDYKLLRYLRIGRKLEIARNWKLKLLETKKVARNTRSCQKVEVQLVESPNLDNC